MGEFSHVMSKTMTTSLLQPHILSSANFIESVKCDGSNNNLLLYHLRPPIPRSWAVDRQRLEIPDAIANQIFLGTASMIFDALAMYLFVACELQLSLLPGTATVRLLVLKQARDLLTHFGTVPGVHVTGRRGSIISVTRYGVLFSCQWDHLVFAGLQTSYN